jgi:DNA invertase Pin-like site-specific DNA recombinase
MVFVMLSAVAEKLREDICENTANAMSHLRSINRRTSRSAPYGYHFVSSGFKPNTVPPQPIYTTEPDIGEQTIIALAVDMRRAAPCGYHTLSSRLADKGIFNREGNPFSQSTLATILKREVKVNAAA